MDLYTLLIMGHIVGTILGVGGATAIETHIGKALRDGKMSPDERSLLGSDFFMTRVGMALTFVTGFGFIWLYYSTNTLFRLENGVFWAKMAMVLVVVVNAYLLHTHKVGLYWGSALSFVSWWGVFFAGFFLSNGVKVYPQDQFISFAIVMVAYGAALVAGAWILHLFRERGKVQALIATAPKITPGEPFVQTADEALGRVPKSDSHTETK